MPTLSKKKNCFSVLRASVCFKYKGGGDFPWIRHWGSITGAVSRPSDSFFLILRIRRPYRRIFVYTFCLINIRLSLSDDANKIKTLNIERAQQFQLSLKTWAQYTEWFRRNSLLKTQNFTENVWLINFLATQQFRSFWWLIFPSIFLV